MWLFTEMCDELCKEDTKKSLSLKVLDDFLMNVEEGGERRGFLRPGWTFVPSPRLLGSLVLRFSGEKLEQRKYIESGFLLFRPRRTITLSRRRTREQI